MLHWCSDDLKFSKRSHKSPAKKENLFEVQCMWKVFLEIINLPFSFDLLLKNFNLLHACHLVSVSWTWLLTYLTCWVCMNKMGTLERDNGFGIAFSSPGFTCYILNLLWLKCINTNWYWHYIYVIGITECIFMFSCLQIEIQSSKKILQRETFFLISTRLYNVHNCL